MLEDRKRNIESLANEVIISIYKRYVYGMSCRYHERESDYLEMRKEIDKRIEQIFDEIKYRTQLNGYIIVESFEKNLILGARGLYVSHVPSEIESAIQSSITKKVIELVEVELKS